MKHFCILLVIMFAVSMTSRARAEKETKPPKGDTTISRERLEEIDEKLDELDELREEVKALKRQGQTFSLGSTKFLITGFAFAGFDYRNAVNPSTFEESSFRGGFAPIFLWRLNKRIFVEAEAEFELEGTDAEVSLEYAQLVYDLWDYSIFGAGLILNPINLFAERYHAAWINKLPDRPLAFGEEETLIPNSELGVQVRGPIPIGPTKITYAVFASNGPRLNDGVEEPEEAGLLHGNTFTDINTGKAVGGRIAFLPIPEIEAGYGVEWADVGQRDTIFSGKKALLHVVDLNIVKEIAPLFGTIQVHGQWAWSKVDAADFGAGFFTNKRNGGYALIGYRPTRVNQKIVRNLEAIFRFDALDRPLGAPMQIDEKRYTVGLDYWIFPSVLAKVAYEYQDRNDPAGIATDINAILAQFAVGF